MPSRRPVVDSRFESNVPGLYIIGDLAGAPVVKLAMEQGFDVARTIAARTDARATEPGAWDVIVAGSGAAGLNAALELQERGLRVLVLEKNRVANTIEDFPEGKWVYAEPDTIPPKGKLWLDGASKEDLLARWHEIIRANGLDVRTGEGLAGVKRDSGGHFRVSTSTGQVHLARHVILATGQRGNPRKLGVAGEERENVYHRLYSPRHYRDEDILVVGGGNSAVEAALTLSEQNRVTLSYRGAELSRVFRDNRRKLELAVAAGRVQLLLNSRVLSFGERTYHVNTPNGNENRAYQHAFVLIGAELPTGFLRSLGVRLENEWTGNPWVAAALCAMALGGIAVFGGQSNAQGLAGPQGLAGLALVLVSVGGLIVCGLRGSRWAWLAVSFLLSYSIYGIKQAPGYEFWPYKGWGAKALTFFERPWSFWYSVLYTLVMTVFGLQALRRWGLSRKDRFQVWRYASLLGFQWTFFFLIPEFLFQTLVRYQWLPQALAADPSFTNNAWRSYGLVYAWPLFFYTFLDAPHQIWVVWGVVLTFVLIPVLALFHGKRYCSWICGCGGLAETLGDRWRHLAPKGNASIRAEWMNTAVLVAAVAATGLLLAQDAVHLLRKPALLGKEWYHLIADVWLVGILPVTLYPFFGGKVWCRYWCPLAKLMQVFSSFFTRFRASRFAIHANDKCIGCGECSRNCQVGIDVMNFALKQDELNNFNSSCIGCGICVTVCPMDVLSFRAAPPAPLVQISVR